MSSAKLRVIDGGVKEGASRGAFYLPHLQLMARAHRLPFSPAAIVLLMHLLEGAGRAGKGEGCGADEGMVARRNKPLAAAMGFSRTALKRTKRELRSVLRTVRINQGQPRAVFDREGGAFTGEPAHAAYLVYYVDLRAIRTLLELQAEHETAHEQAASSAGAAPVLVESPPDLAATLAEYWAARIGKPRSALATTTVRVKRAIAKLLELGTLEEQIRDVVDGASDPALGGKAYSYVVDAGVWDERLFMGSRGPSKSFDHVFRAVEQARAAEKKKQADAAREEQREAAQGAHYCRRHGWRCKTPDACQERSQTGK